MRSSTLLGICRWHCYGLGIGLALVLAVTGCAVLGDWFGPRVQVTPGADGVPGTPDDVPAVDPGPDGQAGTEDDSPVLAPSRAEEGLASVAPVAQALGYGPWVALAQLLLAGVTQAVGLAMGVGGNRQGGPEPQPP